jgi:hypothetical protein
MNLMGKLSSITNPDYDRSFIFSMSDNEEFRKELEEFSFQKIDFKSFSHKFEGSQEEYKTMLSYTYYNHV